MLPNNYNVASIIFEDFTIYEISTYCYVDTLTCEFINRLLKHKKDVVQTIGNIRATSKIVSFPLLRKEFHKINFWSNAPSSELHLGPLLGHSRLRFAFNTNIVTRISNSHYNYCYLYTNGWDIYHLLYSHGLTYIEIKSLVGNYSILDALDQFVRCITFGDINAVYKNVDLALEGAEKLSMLISRDDVHFEDVDFVNFMCNFSR